MSQAQKFYPSCRTRRRPAVALFITRISRGGYFSSLNLAPNLEALHLRCGGRQSEEHSQQGLPRLSAFRYGAA